MLKLEGKGRVCDSVRIELLPPGKDIISHICHLLVCLFALSPPEEKKKGGTGKGGSVMQEKEGKGRETGRNRELLTEEERGNHVEEPTCDSCPTSMHRCEC